MSGNKNTPAVQAYQREALAPGSLLRSFLDTQSDLISQATQDGQLIYVNPAYAAHLGRAVESLIGTNLFEYVEPSDLDIVRERIRRVMSSGDSLTSDNRISTSHDGGERWIAWTNSRQPDHDGGFLLQSTGRDVTARVLAERELHSSRAFLARIGEVAGIGGWSLDIATNAVTWSDQTRRIHEVPLDFMPTLETALRFYAPESRPVIEEAVREGLAKGTPWDLELQVITAKERRIWARAVGEVEFEDGRAVRLFGTFQDITERHLLREQVAADERFLRQLTDSLPLRIAYLDRERRYRFVNQEWCRLTGLERAHVIGRTRAEVMPQQDDATLRQRALAVLAGLDQRFEFDEVIDGQPRRFENRLIPHRDDQGNVQGFFVTGVDVTETLRQTTTLRSVTDAISSTVAVMSNTGQYRFVNRAFERFVAKSQAEILGKGAREILGEEEFARRRPWIDQALQGQHVTFELDHVGPQGRTYMALEYIPLRLASGEVDGFIVITQDVTPRKREESRLRLLSQTDPLTGALNRAGFDQRLHGIFDECAGEPLAILYVDLDRFKIVNDTLGHAAGDSVLKQTAMRLSRLVRPSDTVARLGGDEFAVLLPGMRDSDQARRVGDQIVASLKLPFELDDGHEVNVGASVGGALGLAVRDELPDLLDRADRMLYRVKHSGRGHVAIDEGP